MDKRSRVHTGIDIAKIGIDAKTLFHDNLEHGFYCSEAIVSSIRDNIDTDMPAEMISAASGFPVGIGRSKCLCGAVAGSIICLGYFFGRSAPSSIDDPASVHTLKLAHEAQQHFKDNYRVLCCSVQTKDMDMGAGEHREQCARFTGEMAEVTGRIIARELGLETC
jgi:C_GCAxxG_C_C family probable redox protein